MPFNVAVMAAALYANASNQISAKALITFAQLLFAAVIPSNLR